MKTDSRDLRPGAKYYYWEMRGVSLRLEIGPRDIDASQVTVVTRTGARSVIPLGTLVPGIKDVVAGETARMKERADVHLKSRLIISETMDEAKRAIEQGIVLVPWCEEKGCADVLEERLGASVLGTRARSPHLREQEGPCVVCGKPGKTTLVGRAY